MNPDTDATKVARLEVEVSNLHQIVRALAALPTQLATNTAEQAALSRDVANLRQEWRDDVQHFDQAIGDLKEEIKNLREGQKQAELNRKADVKWTIGTLIAVAVVILGVLGLLLG